MPTRDASEGGEVIVGDFDLDESVGTDKDKNHKRRENRKSINKAFKSSRTKKLSEQAPRCKAAETSAVHTVW